METKTKFIIETESVMTFNDEPIVRNGKTLTRIEYVVSHNCRSNMPDRAKRFDSVEKALEFGNKYFSGDGVVIRAKQI